MEKIKLDLIPSGKMPSLHASQYDDGREHGIDLFENGVVYKLDGTETLTINERKGDDCICSLDIENTFADSNHIVFASTEQMCAVWGNNICELVIAKGEKTIGTLNFILEVEQSPTEGGIESESEIKNLKRQIEEITEEVIGDDYYTKTQTDGLLVDKANESEVANIRVGVDGTTYQSAGDAVRGQISNLGNVVDSISTPGKNLFDKNHANVIDAVPDGGTSKYKSSSYGKTVWIECSPNTTYTVSKIQTSRFAISYGEEEPAVGVSFDDYTSNASKTALTITTNNTAKYLAVYLYYSSLDTEKTLAEVLATLQVEVGSEATQYEPFKLIANDSAARGEIEEINNTLENYEKQVTVNSTRQNASYGSELINDFSSMTAIGDSTFADGKWTIPNDSGISTSLNVEANTTYLIQLDVTSATTTDGSGNHKVNPLLISLGDDNIEIFANPDANWKVCLTPTASGSITFAIECEEALSIVLAGVSVKPVTSYPNAPIVANGKTLFATNTSGYSFAFGGGQAKRTNGTMNTAFGYDSQKELDTGYADTAFGHNAQRDIRNGRGNCAFGHRAQEAITTGMYNNAVGTVAQGAITSGCWNNAVGNEAQRDLTTGCDNTSIGRRAHSYITSGNLNTAVGSQAGFATKTHQDGSWATKTASYQTLIGAEACQNSATQADYLTALGYRAVGGEKALALGANSSANGVKSVAIGYGVTAENDGDVVVGDADSKVFLGDKELGVDIYTAEQVDAIIDSILPTDSAIGAIASFKTSLEKPIEFEAEFGADANGVSQIKIVQTGSNIFNGETESGSFDTTTGEKTTNNNLVRSVNPIAVKPGETYMRVIDASLGFRVFYYDENMQFISTDVSQYTQLAITIPNNCYYINIAYQKTISQVSINYPSTDTSFNTYNSSSNVETISLGSAYYNGGKITQDKEGHRTVTADGVTTSLPDGTPKNALIGTNNIWADTGDVDVSFKCSVEDYVNAHSGGGLRSLGNSNENLSKGGSEEEPKEEIKTIGEKKIGGE